MPEPIDVDVTGRRIPERPAIATGVASSGSKVAADDGGGDHPPERVSMRWMTG